MLGEADLLHLQNSWSKENEKICDKVFEQLMNDLLTQDEQNQNKGYMLGQSDAHLKLGIKSYDPPEFGSSSKFEGMQSSS